jgi:hypothetical protein
MGFPRLLGDPYGCPQQYWARGPATDGHAAELARASPSWAKSGLPAVVDLSRPVPRISIRRPTVRIGRSKPTGSQSLVNPSPIPSPPHALARIEAAAGWRDSWPAGEEQLSAAQQ